jgi:hypothetical protein
MQPALFIWSVSLNKHLTSRVMHVRLVAINEEDIIPYNNNNSSFSSNSSSSLGDRIQHNNNGTVEWISFHLDKSIGLCSSIACCFGILYLLTLRSNREYCFLHNEDDEPVMNMVEKGAAETGVQALELGRLAFWCFVFVHGYTISLAGSSVHDMEHLQIQIACRVASMWILCRTGRSIRGKIPILLGGFLYFVWGYGMLVTETQQAVMLVIQFVLDMLLFVGHRWEVHAPALTVVNCRLFYVALVSALLV